MSVDSITSSLQCLTFGLDDEVFAIEVAQVREVLDMCPITKVPRAPAFMRGITNVRGSVVPVVDLRLKFGLNETQTTRDTRIIVMEIQSEGEALIIGALADAVHEVMELDAESIDPVPKIGIRWRTEYIRGIGKQSERFVILLDIDRIFSFDELTEMEASVA